jgi:hypothetical protein
VVASFNTELVLHFSQPQPVGPRVRRKSTKAAEDQKVGY